MSTTFDKLFMAVMSAAAIVMAIALAKREFWSAPTTRASPASPTRVDENVWHELTQAGPRIGDSASTVTIIEFGDFECPFCRRFHSAVNSLPADLRRSLGLVFVHFPVRGHRFAIPAARAAECAARQGRFSEMADALFIKQDSLGLKTWMAFAEDAGIADSTRFARCIAEPGEVPRVAAGRKLGERMGVRGTPTVIIYGRRYGAPPNAAELERLVRSLLPTSARGVGTT